MAALTFAGYPCRNGHIGTRWLESGKCIACEMLQQGTVLTHGNGTSIPPERHVVEINAIVTYGDESETAVIVATLSSRGRFERREFLTGGTLEEVTAALADLKRWVELNHAHDPRADEIANG